MIFLLGTLIVGFFTCTITFVDKIPLCILSPIEFLVLKSLLCLIPVLLFFFYVFYRKKYDCQFYNKKLILMTTFTLFIAVINYYLYVTLLKKYPAGILMPAVLSCTVIFTLLFDHYIFNKKIRKIDLLCIFLIAVSIYTLASNIQDDSKSLKEWSKYLKE